MWHPIRTHAHLPQARADKWQPHVEAGRKKYNMSDDEDVTARPHVQLRGCATQSTTPNALHETVNIRWSALADHRGMARTAEPSLDMWCDVRYSYERQQKAGHVTLLGASLPYNFALDRVMPAVETVRHQRWPSSCALNCANLADPVAGIINGQISKLSPIVQPKKKARTSVS